MGLAIPDYRPKDGKLEQLKARHPERNCHLLRDLCLVQEGLAFHGLPASCLQQTLQEFWRLPIDGQGQGPLAALEGMWTVL